MTVYQLCREGNCNPYTCAVCAQEPEPETLPDPDDLTPADAACWAAMCTAVASAVRHELPYATAERVAEELDQRAGAYRDRAITTTTARHPAREGENR